MIVFWFAVCALAGYLLGSFNGAILISRWFRKEDIRTKGSGNAALRNETHSRHIGFFAAVER